MCSITISGEVTLIAGVDTVLDPRRYTTVVPPARGGVVVYREVFAGNERSCFGIYFALLTIQLGQEIAAWGV